MQKPKLISAKRLAILPLLASLTALSVLSGCATAAVGAAGAAGGIAYSDRGAKGHVQGDVAEVTDAARATLQEMNLQITETETKRSGQEQELEAQQGDTKVTVNLTQSGADSTHVEVVAKDGTFKWNKDYAKDILARIVNKR